LREWKQNSFCKLREKKEGLFDPLNYKRKIHIDWIIHDG